MVNRTRLLVAADKELGPYAKLCGLAFTGDFDGGKLVRAYIQQGRNIPNEMYKRMPEDLPYDIVPITHKLPHIDRKVSNPTPYADMELAPLGVGIPSTININQPPPRGIGDQIWQNFL